MNKLICPFKDKFIVTEMCLKRDEFRAEFSQCEQNLREFHNLRSYLTRATNVYQKEEKINSLERQIGSTIRLLADLRYILSRPCSYDGCR